jgi:transposase
MSLHPQQIPTVPEATAATARAAFPRGNRYLAMRHALGVFYTDHDFAALFPTRGQPAETPWRLALVLVFQFAEGLSDEQAAEAVRSRIDWKYALSLELTDRVGCVWCCWCLHRLLLAAPTAASATRLIIARRAA